ncbi:MAG: hypothetical protein QFB87_01260 [Patescibacteria group bacterium]|nr:hypothetical protein [Patescibacteria group bacterium]
MKQLNVRGAAHFAALAIVILGIAVFGTYKLVASHADSLGDRLSPSQKVLVGQSIVSADGGMKLNMQSDGNLVLRNRNGAAVWYSNSRGTNAELAFQGDGNLVVRSGTTVIWNGMTNGKGGVLVVLQNDGNLVMRNSAGASVWTTGTSGKEGTFPSTTTTTTSGSTTTSSPTTTSTGTSSGTTSTTTSTSITPATGYQFKLNQTLTAGKQLISTDGGMKLTMQGDGNLTLRNREGAAVWYSNTRGTNATATFQGDGNLVVRLGTTTLWSSQTNGKGGAVIAVQNDGNVVMRSSNATTIWTTGTSGKQGSFPATAPAATPVTTTSPSTTTSTITPINCRSGYFKDADGTCVTLVKPTCVTGTTLVTHAGVSGQNTTYYCKTNVTVVGVTDNAVLISCNYINADYVRVTIKNSQAECAVLRSRSPNEAARPINCSYYDAKFHHHLNETQPANRCKQLVEHQPDLDKRPVSCSIVQLDGKNKNSASTFGACTALQAQAQAARLAILKKQTRCNWTDKTGFKHINEIVANKDVCAAKVAESPKAKAPSKSAVAIFVTCKWVDEDSLPQTAKLTPQLCKFVRADNKNHHLKVTPVIDTTHCTTPPSFSPDLTTLLSSACTNGWQSPAQFHPTFLTPKTTLQAELNS